MNQNYELWLTDDSGRRIWLLPPASFNYSRTENGYGTIQVNIPLDEYVKNVPGLFQPDWRVDVYRSPAEGYPARREGSFFLRKFIISDRSQDAMRMIQLIGRSPLDILRRRSIVSTTLANYQKTDYIDDMMKEIVTETFITVADDDSAVPVVLIGGVYQFTGEFAVEPQLGLGPSTTHTFQGKNVLDVLKELKAISFTKNKASSSNLKIYFDIVESAPIGSGFGYIFRTFAGMRGADRTHGTVFSVENGNLKDPVYYEDYLDEATYAQKNNYSLPAVNGSSKSADRYLSRWNNIVDAEGTYEKTLAANNASADQMLESNAKDIAFNGTFLNTPGNSQQPRSLYGLDWDLGDILPVQYAGKTFTAEVKIVYISVNDQGVENIVGQNSVGETA